MLKKIFMLLAAVLACGLVAAAQQEVRTELSVSGDGIFTNDTSGNGLTHSATNSGGVIAGFRFNFNKWGAMDLNYGWNRNSQEYFTTGIPIGDRIQSDVHQTTLDFVAKLPTFRHFRPYVLAGGGALIFDPVDRFASVTALSTGILPGSRIPTRAQGTFVYGGGADFDLTARGVRRPGVSLRLGYRGYVYGAPNFGFSQLDVRTVTHTAQPEAGLVFRF